MTVTCSEPRRTAWLMLVAALCSSSAAMAQEPAEVNDNGLLNNVSVTFEAAFNSRYIWRGLNVVDDPVFQPSVSATYEGFTASVWGNMETTNKNRYAGHGDSDGEFTEVDYTLDYSWSMDELTFSLGTIYYDFPNTGSNSTTELYGAISVDAPLQPAFTIYKDIDETDGIYAALSAGHTFDDLWKPSEATSVSAALGGSLGWGSGQNNRSYYGTNDSGFADLTLTASLPVALGTRWQLTPSVGYSRLMDHSVRRAVAREDNSWWGVSLSCGF